MLAGFILKCWAFPWREAFGPGTWSSWALFGAAVWASCLALRTLGAIKEQAHEMSRQNRNMVKKERARLSIEVSWGGFIRPEQWEQLGEMKISFAISICNHGPTKAFNVCAWGLALLASTNEPPPMESATAFYLEDVIEGGKNISVDIPSEIRVKHTSSIRAEKVFIHCFGFVTYTDVFDAQHKTPFRYLYKNLDREVEGRVEDDSGWTKLGPASENLAV